MKKPAMKSFKPRIRFVSPRFQGPSILAFAAITTIGGAIFWKLVDDEFRRVFLHAAIRGHYTFNSAYDIVRDLLVRHMAELFAGVFLAGSVLVLLLAYATRHSIGKAIDSLRASADGDLSTPTRMGFIDSLYRFGDKFDAARTDTLDSIRKIRSEATGLSASGIPTEEFRLRWDELKQEIRRIAP